MALKSTWKSFYFKFWPSLVAAGYEYFVFSITYRVGLDQLWQLILSWRIKMHLNRSSCKMILKFNINICVCGNAYILLFSKSLSSIFKQIKILYKHWQLIQIFAYNSHKFNQIVSTFQIIKGRIKKNKVIIITFGSNPPPPLKMIIRFLATWPIFQHFWEKVYFSLWKPPKS